MRILHLKNKRFLKSFLSLALVLFLIMLVILGTMYSMSIKTLEKEVTIMNMNRASDLLNKFEDLLNQCNLLAANLVSNPTVQRFSAASEPDLLVKNFYSLLNETTSSFGLSYIDSVILYAPKYDRVYIRGQFSSAHTVEELREMDELVDLSWLGLLEEGERTTTSFYIRAKEDVWPYYITLIKHRRTTAAECVAIINIDLRKLYDYLISQENPSMELYALDEQDRVILRAEKQELTLDPSAINHLSLYQSGETHSSVDQKSGIVYAQAFSEKYGYTIVTIKNLDEYFHSLSRIHWQFVAWGMVALVIVSLLAFLYSVRLVRPINTIQKVLDSPLEWRNEREKHDQDIADIADEIVHYLQFNSQLQEELSNRLELLSRTQMLALQAQINPHFLFNTLNMICLMVERDCGDDYLGGQMIRSLSDILRYALTDRKLSTLKEEIEYAEKYLSILQQRYRNFEYSLEIDPELHECLLPKMVLQPLLENAMQHGLSGSMPQKKGDLRLIIQRTQYTYESGKTLASVYMEVKDNGVGISTEKFAKIAQNIQNYSDISTDHIGLSNVAHRFYLCFHNEQSVRLSSEEGMGTSIVIVFPACKELDVTGDGEKR